jgi:hypothetical protein
MFPTLDATLSMDTEKGALWFTDLKSELQDARMGLICVTPESVASPWLHFEAGILSKALREDSRLTGDRGRSAGLRIFPFLHDVAPDALRDPLSAFQNTVATDRDDAWQLIETIRSILKEHGTPASARSLSPSPRTVRRTFEQKWKSFQTELRRIKPCPLSEVVPDFRNLFERKTFDESMYDCLTQGWLQRYDAAREVWGKLKKKQSTVRKACRPSVVKMFDGVVTSLDAYAMCLAVLIGKPESPIRKNGTVAFTHPGVAKACEGHRKRIKGLVARLVGSSRPRGESLDLKAARTIEARRRVTHSESRS